MGATESFETYRITGKICLAVVTAFFVTDMTGWLYSGIRAWLSDDPSTLKVLHLLSPQNIEQRDDSSNKEFLEAL